MPNPTPKPKLTVLRMGNPGHASKSNIEAREGIKFPPAAPTEPDWHEWFPGTPDAPSESHDAQLCRERAAREWAAIVPLLDAQGLLALVDLTLLADHCVIAARIAQCERAITQEGLTPIGHRNAHGKHPASTIVGAYRTQLRWTMSQLWLTPVSRAAALSRPSGGGGGPDDSPWDA